MQEYETYMYIMGLLREKGLTIDNARDTAKQITGFVTSCPHCGCTELLCGHHSELGCSHTEEE